MVKAPQRPVNLAETVEGRRIGLDGVFAGFDRLVDLDALPARLLDAVEFTGGHLGENARVASGDSASSLASNLPVATWARMPAPSKAASGFFSKRIGRLRTVAFNSSIRSERVPPPTPRSSVTRMSRSSRASTFSRASKASASATAWNMSRRPVFKDRPRNAPRERWSQVGVPLPTIWGRNVTSEGLISMSSISLPRAAARAGSESCPSSITWFWNHSSDRPPDWFRVMVKYWSRTAWQ
jgi:hypothetical protein